MEDVDGFEGHFLETRLIKSVGAVAEGVVALVAEVLRVDVSVEPFGHIGDGEDAEGFRGVPGGG